jgi:addiction module RelE/StbE family toxin
MLNGTVEIKWSDEALEGLSKIGDQTKQDKIRKKVKNDLSKDPYKGKPLSGSFKSLRSFHVLGNRVRVAYQVIEEKIKIV